MPVFSRQQIMSADRPSPSSVASEQPGIRPAKSPAQRLDEIQLSIRRYNSDIDTGSEAFRAAVLLLLARDYGQNIDMLARRTGFDRSFVARCARRLIDNGVWQGGLTIADWTAGDEASGSFWNDVAVAMGKLCRRIGADGITEWAPAGFWNKSYHFLAADDEPPQVAIYHDPATVQAEHPVPLRAELEPVDGSAPPENRAPLPPAQQPPGLDVMRPRGDGPPAAGHPRPDARPPAEHHRLPTLDELFSDAVWLG